MSKETAKHCLLFVGDRGKAAVTGQITLALEVTGETFVLTDSANGLDGVAAHDLIAVSGFANTPAFVAVVKQASAGSVTFVAPVDKDTRKDVTITAEVAGESVSVSVEKFTELLGQNSTTYDKSASNIDTKDKNSGNWGSSLAGAVSMSANASGQIVFTDDGKHGGWTALNTAVDNGDTVNLRLVLNTKLDAYYGPFSISSQNGGGGTDDVNGYTFAFSNSARPVYVVGA